MLALGFALAAWFAVAAWAIVRGVSMQRKAAVSAAQTARLSTLIDAAPALPMLIRPDLKIECPDRLALWLGLDHMPRFLDDLVDQGGRIDSGLDDAQLHSLRGHIQASQRSGRSFAFSLSAPGSGRTLMVNGGPAPAQLGATGAVLLWLFDITESQGALTALQRERDQAIAGFDSLSVLTEAAPFPMWFRDRSLALRLVNRAYVEAAGLETSDAVIEGGVELIEPVAGETAEDCARRASERGEAVQRSIPVTVAGQRRMMRVVDIPLGQAGVAGYAIDIQELENARANFRRFSSAQRDLLDRLSSGVAQFGSDRQLRFVNQPFSRIFGIEPAELKDHGEFDRFLDRLHRQGRTPEVRDYPAWRRERRDWFASTDVQDERWLLRDGTHLHTVAQPTPEGGLLLIFEDRTEQVQLATSRDTLLRVRTATFDNLFESIAVFATDGRLQLWNRRFREIWEVEEAMLTKHPRVDELLKAIAPRLLRPQQAPVIQELVRGATGERRQRVGKVAFRDGRHFEFAAVPLPDGNALFTMLDVSDSRRIEQALRDRNEALEDADRIKSAFLSKMSYELRTPLTSIGGFAEMLEKGYVGELSEPAHEYVRAIIESVESLGRQIDNVLDLSQSEAGTLPIQRKPVDLAKVGREAAAEATAAATAVDIELVASFDSSVGVIEGDERRIKQVVDHLLGNAIRFTAARRGKPGRVLVHGDGDDKRARLIISDNGPGIPADQQEGLFKLVIRRAADVEQGQNGLGLPLSRQLIEAHGGTLVLVSQVDEGTMITIELPRG